MKISSAKTVEGHSTVGEGDLSKFDVIGGIFDAVANKVKNLRSRRKSEELDVRDLPSSQRRGSQDDMEFGGARRTPLQPMKKLTRRRSNSTDSPRVALSSGQLVRRPMIWDQLNRQAAGEPLADLRSGAGNAELEEMKAYCANLEAACASGALPRSPRPLTLTVAVEGQSVVQLDEDETGRASTVAVEGQSVVQLDEEETGRASTDAVMGETPPSRTGESDELSELRARCLELEARISDDSLKTIRRESEEKSISRETFRRENEEMITPVEATESAEDELASADSIVTIDSGQGGYGDETPDEMNARYTRSAMLKALEQQQQLMMDRDKSEKELQELNIQLAQLNTRSDYFRQQKGELEQLAGTGGQWLGAKWRADTGVNLNRYMTQRIRSHDVEAIKLLLQYVTRLDECMDVDTGLNCLETLLKQGALVNNSEVVAECARAVGAWCAPVHDIEESQWYEAGMAMIAATGLDGKRFDFSKPVGAAHGSGSVLHLLLRNTPSPQRDALCTQLLSAGANALQQDLSGVSAMHMAATEGSISLLSAMLSTAQESGHLDFALRHVTLAGHSVLHLAAAGVNTDGFSRAHGCESLIMCRASVNAVSAIGETPLHMAARWGDLQVRCAQFVELSAQH